MSSKPTPVTTKKRGATVPMSLVAERAYFKAEQRGFAPGHEIEDWLAAERELAAPPAPPKAKRVRRLKSVGS